MPRPSSPSPPARTATGILLALVLPPASGAAPPPPAPPVAAPAEGTPASAPAPVQPPEPEPEGRSPASRTPGDEGGAGQDGQAPGEEGIATFGEEVSVSWVLVPVVVRSRGQAVEGLDRNDFRLFVDGRRVAVDEFDAGADVPLSIVYLQDLSGSMGNAGKLGASRRAFTNVLERLREGDELALATFAGDRLRIEVPFTSNVTALGEAEDLWEGYGTTALHDAISLLPDISEEGRSGRRVAVLVTDGQDNASALEPAEAVSIVERARLPVYVIGLTARGRNAPAPTLRDGDAGFRYADLLGELASRTGGAYFEAAGPEDATEAVASIVDDLRQRYILSLSTRAEGPRTYRRIRVEVALPYRHELTFRKGYFGPPPAAASAGRR